MVDPKRGRIMSGHLNRERAEAHGRLMGALSAACDDGERVPCVGEPETWDGELPELEEAAIHGCGVCDQFKACRRYVTAYPEPEGVWAGLTNQQRATNRRETTA